MIVQEDFLKKLRAVFDLNIYEVKIWTALLSRGIASAGELSDISNVPRSRSYDVLESLEKKGFIIMKVGKPIKYIAVEPKEIIKRVKKTLQNKTEERLNSLENVKSSKLFNELELIFKQGIDIVDPSNLSGAIRGRHNLYGQIENLMDNAKKSIIIVTSSDGFLRKMNAFRKTLKKAKDDKVKIKIGTQVNDKVKEAVKELKGMDVRNVDVKARFVIIDGTDIMFMVSDDKEVHESYDLGIWVKSPFFAKAMENLIDVNWNKLDKI